MTIASREIIFNTSPILTEEWKWSMPSYSYSRLVSKAWTTKYFTHSNIVSLHFTKACALFQH
ncbi:DUF1801 domain-containing protein [Oceanobacillus polygoni]